LINSSRLGLVSCGKTASRLSSLVRGSESQIAPSKIMVALSRRSFLTSSVAVVAHPALAIPASSGVDVIIVGAGATGIAAARRLVAARRKLAIFEASDRVGGRCFTDMRTFGIPYDRGAHWIHTPETNPLAKLGLKAGLDIYAAPPRQQLRLGLGSGIRGFFGEPRALQARHR
jgi:hypothetical protein